MTNLAAHAGCLQTGDADGRTCRGPVCCRRVLAYRGRRRRPVRALSNDRRPLRSLRWTGHRGSLARRGRRGSASRRVHKGTSTVKTSSRQAIVLPRVIADSGRVGGPARTRPHAVAGGFLGRGKRIGERFIRTFGVCVREIRQISGVRESCFASIRRKAEDNGAGKRRRRCAARGQSNPTR
jgi:hypothetical protein